MNSIIQIFRKKTNDFNSIENVFNTLLPYLNVTKVELPYSSQGIFPRLKNIFFIAKRKSSLIHITGHDHYLLWYPFKKAILTIHDIEAYNRKKGFKKWIFKLLWFDIPIRNATMVTTISEFSKNEILSMRKYKTPIHVIPNPITLALKYSPKVFNQDRPRILHLGVKANKNLERLIHSLIGINCELIIIGGETAKLAQILNENKILYRFKSGLSNTEVKLEYEKCDFLAFVSTYEGFGLPIIEAQAIGRPILTSNCSSMPEVAGEGALFVDPYNVNSIRDGINQLIKNENLRNSLICEGLKNIKRFNPEVIANQYRFVFEKI